MKATSHFIWIEIKSKILSDIFIEVYQYCKKRDILDTIVMQNPLSLHITLYYLEKDISNLNIEKIKNDISKIKISEPIYMEGINYFSRNSNKSLLYFTTNTKLPFKEYRDLLHLNYNRINVDNNKLSFSPHITFLRILEPSIYELHRNNIEDIVNKECTKIKNVDISTSQVSLYRVNSSYPWQIQIKL